MNIVPKANLIDGAYYDGVSDMGNPYVAKWVAKDNAFEVVIQHWSGPLLTGMCYWDETSEYFESFHPLFVVEPRESEKTENVQ